MKKQHKRILVIPDLHIPFMHKDALKFLKGLKKEFSPDLVVSIGDICDLNAFSTHEREEEANGLNELEEVRDGVQQLAAIFPTIAITTGNHDIRIAKRVKEAGVPLQCLKSLNEIIGAPKSWSWHTQYKVNTATGVVVFEHGTNSKSAESLAIKNGVSSVMGHLHSKAGITYLRNEANPLFFAMGVGALVDEESYGFRYAKAYKSKNIYSAGVIINGVPQLIPLL